MPSRNAEPVSEAARRGDDPSTAYKEVIRRQHQLQMGAVPIAKLISGGRNQHYISFDQGSAKLTVEKKRPRKSIL